MDEEKVKDVLGTRFPEVDEPIIDHLASLIATESWNDSNELFELCGELLELYECVNSKSDAELACLRLARSFKKEISTSGLESKNAVSTREEWTVCVSPSQLKPNQRIQALFHNDKKWYPAMYLRPSANDVEEGEEPRFVVEFSGYGNQETVAQSEIKITKEYTTKASKLGKSYRMEDASEHKIKVLGKKKLDFKQREKQRLQWEETQKKKEAIEKAKYEKLQAKEEKRLKKAEKRKAEAFETYLASRFHSRDTEVDLSDFTLYSDAETGGELISNQRLSFAKGHKYGLIGRNGCGKTTLLRHMSTYAIDKFPLHIRIAHVEQETRPDKTRVLDAVVSADRERTLLLQEEKQLTESKNSDGMRLAQVYERLEEIDAGAAEGRAAAILTGLGFTADMQQMTTKQLSGGWRMRVALACGLFVEPDILLLDEPTNHLDFPAVLWLEDYLIKYKSTVVVVSHDRIFLNNVITDVIHCDRKRLDYYRGDYNTFEKVRAERKAQQHKEYLANEQKRAHMQSFVDRFRCNAKRATLVQSRIKALNRLGFVDDIETDPIFQFQFPFPEELQHDNIIECYNMSFGYFSDKMLMENVNFNVNTESRIGVLGANGVGKSTLIHLIMDDLEPNEGQIKVNTSAKIATFSQHHVDTLVLHLSPLDMLMKMFPNEGSQQIQAHLGRFGIVPPLSYQSIGTLSGGQKSRVSFAIITHSKPHLVIMDEPTNHLDLETIEALIMAINGYQGAVMVVSHDQYFLQNVCQEFWAVGNRKIVKYNKFEDAKKGAYVKPKV